MLGVRLGDEISVTVPKLAYRIVVGTPQRPLQIMGLTTFNLEEDDCNRSKFRRSGETE